MNKSLSETASLHPAPSSQERRRESLIAIIQDGLPPFPHIVTELTAILSGPSADVKKAAKLIRTDPTLSVQVLRLCNSPILGLRSRVISIEQAAMLLGSEQLRSLALTSSLVEFAGHGLPKEQTSGFWKHSFLAAMLSEHLAKERDYPEKEQAYIAGLLHDIGQVPQRMLAYDEHARNEAAPPDGWFDNIAAEREHFGMDHCEIGSRMASSWNFMPSFIDVLVCHHEPEHAEHDPYLVQIVAAVEHYLLTRMEDATAANDAAQALDQLHDQLRDQSQADEVPASQFAERSRQPFSDSEWPAIAESLEIEYSRLLPIVQSGLTSIIAAN